jgi:hypothetical protein
MDWLLFLGLSVKQYLASVKQYIGVFLLGGRSPQREAQGRCLPDRVLFCGLYVVFFRLSILCTTLFSLLAGTSLGLSKALVMSFTS